MDRRTLSEDDLKRFVEDVQHLKRDGLTVTEIAERLGLHRNTVNWRLRRWRTTHPA
jgi:orotate phosphoribosyltransferase-like protein